MEETLITKGFGVVPNMEHQLKGKSSKQQSVADKLRPTLNKPTKPNIEDVWINQLNELEWQPRNQNRR